MTASETVDFIERIGISPGLRNAWAALLAPRT
jgi:hypothetical protein